MPGRMGEFVDSRNYQNHLVTSGTGEIVNTLPATYDLSILMTDLIYCLNPEGTVHPVPANANSSESGIRRQLQRRRQK